MNRPWWLYAIAICCMALVLVSAHRSASAMERASSAHRRLATARNMGHEILALREQRERVFIGQRPTEDTIAHIDDTLTAAGLPAATLRALDPNADTPLGDGDYRRQSVRLTLEPLTPAQLGDFLIAWESAATPWTITGVELSHRARARDNTYTVVLVLSATYIDDSDGRPGYAFD